MATFVYRCPKTGFNIQGWVENEPADETAFVSVACPLCNHVHLVNPKSGEGPGDADMAKD
jgi:hypothetical protein